ncbi:T-complex 11, partial [Entophlyctis helioformis]
DALQQIILQAHRFSESNIVPETLRMDTSRLISFYNDWQDITILSSLLVLFRQAAGPRCTNEHLREAKSSLWVLLNDSDTTMSHITLQVAHISGGIRGKPFADNERDMLSNMMEKTLAPDSKLYDLIQKRVGENLKQVVVKGAVDKDMLSKHGMAQLEKEVSELGMRIRKVGELNRAIFGKVYGAILEDIMAGTVGAESPHASAVLA